MRKLLLSVGCLMFMAGVVVAADYTVSKPLNKDTKTVTLKGSDGKEVEAKLTPDTKVVRVDKTGNKTEGKVDGLEKMLSSEKIVGKKIDATIKDGKIVEVTTKGGGKKKNK